MAGGGRVEETQREKERETERRDRGRSRERETETEIGRDGQTVRQTGNVEYHVANGVA